MPLSEDDKKEISVLFETFRSKGIPDEVTAADPDDDGSDVAIEPKKTRKPKSAAREIPAASESTVHAVLEETRALRAELAERGVLAPLVPKDAPAASKPDVVPAPKVPGNSEPVPAKSALDFFPFNIL
jgi:hypothetical protein